MSTHGVAIFRSPESHFPPEDPTPSLPLSLSPLGFAVLTPSSTIRAVLLSRRLLLLFPSRIFYLLGTRTVRKKLPFSHLLSACCSSNCEVLPDSSTLYSIFTSASCQSCVSQSEARRQLPFRDGRNAYSEIERKLNVKRGVFSTLETISSRKG